MSGGDAVVILGGGSASRLPGKLERPIEGRPLLVRVYENTRDAGTTYVSAAATFEAAVDAALDCPLVIDRWPGRGPLAGLLSTAGQVRERRFFAVAGDAPAITTEVLALLRAAWQDGDEAVVPEHDGRLEPLAALYDREAFLREGSTAFAAGTASMHAVLDRLRVRTVTMPATYFVNVNTAEDWPTRNEG